MGMGVAVTNLERIRDAAETTAGPAAAKALAKQGQQLDREILSLTAHGPGTHTPSPEGGPPSMITGTLAASIFAGEPEPSGPFQWSAHAGPTAAASSPRGPYGRFLQFGGTHNAHQPKGMLWWEDGRLRPARRLRPLMSIDKGPRDYLWRAILAGIADGSLHDAAVQAFLEAVFAAA